MPVSGAAGVRKTTPRPPKNTKKLPSNHERDREHGFCNTSTFRTKFESSNCQEFHSKFDAKSDLETSPKKTLNFTHLTSERRPLLKWVPEITPKIRENRFRIPACPSCCSHCPPRCPQATKMAPGCQSGGTRSAK